MSVLALVLPSVVMLRLSIAAVWLYEGLWCKVLGGNPSHQAVVVELPGFTPPRALTLLKAVGVVEITLGLWVLTGVDPRWCAAAEALLLIVMTANTLLWARNLIFDPVGMVLRNATFLMLIWVCGVLAIRR